jgi:hypothetical protein
VNISDIILAFLQKNSFQVSTVRSEDISKKNKVEEKKENPRETLDFCRGSSKSRNFPVISKNQKKFPLLISAS